MPIDNIPPRIIARLDIKGDSLIKGIHLEGLRKVGDPVEFAKKYYNEGIDEIFLNDCVASLYGRNALDDIISIISEEIFVPITVGGGIRSVDDGIRLLKSGADKLSINTAAVLRKELLKELTDVVGSQSVALSVEAKKSNLLGWEVYTDNGREPSGISVIDWVDTAIDIGVGEIIVTSIDNEGTRKGYDLELIKSLNSINVPLIISGGLGEPSHASLAVECGADGIAIADYFHFDRGNVEVIRNKLEKNK